MLQVPDSLVSGVQSSKISMQNRPAKKYHRQLKSLQACYQNDIKSSQMDVNCFSNLKLQLEAAPLGTRADERLSSESRLNQQSSLFAEICSSPMGLPALQQPSLQSYVYSRKQTSFDKHRSQNLASKQQLSLKVQDFKSRQES